MRLFQLFKGLCQHKRQLAVPFFVLVFLASTTVLVSQKSGIQTIDLNLQSPNDLIITLLGGGIYVCNVNYTGAHVAAGTFTGAAGIFDSDYSKGLKSGFILSSGDISLIAGPNNSDSITKSNYFVGDPDLDELIPGYKTYDATVLEFDFIPAGDKVTFRFVFASEEYNEYVHSWYNDVFGFFVNGANLALLPDGVTPVAINNVNNGNPYGTNPRNPEYYINNDLNDGGGSIDIEADGFTVILEFVASVFPYEMNHFKLAIADAGDHILDSWVVIEADSFTTPDNNKVPFDIKPGSCPNPLNMGSKGVFPAAILGTADFDVNQIDIESIRLFDVAPVVAPLRSAFEDVVTPFVPYTGKVDKHDCNEAGPDGFLDLTLKFDKQEVVQAFEESLGRKLEDGEVLLLPVTGKLLDEFDGTEFQGEDVVVIKRKGKK